MSSVEWTVVDLPRPLRIPRRIGGPLAALAAVPAVASAVLSPSATTAIGAGCALTWALLMIFISPRLDVNTGELGLLELFICIASSALAIPALVLCGAGGYPVVAAVVTMAGIHLPRRWALAFVALLSVILWTQVMIGAPASDRPRAALGVASLTLSFLGLARLLRRALVERRRVEELSEQLRKANLLLQEQARERESWARQRERTRIARDLHDSLGHALTALHLQLQLAQRSKEPAIPLDKALTLTQEGLRALRQSVSVLREEPPSPSLERAVRELIQALPPVEIDLGVEVLGPPRNLPSVISYALYRAAQEGLTNALRHAGASRVTITLDYGSPDTVRLTVEDDGRGAEECLGRSGLSGVRERVEALGGTTEVRTRPGEGFSLEVSISS